MAPKDYSLRFAVEASFLLLIFSLGFMQPNTEIRGVTVPVTDLLFLVTGTIWLVAIIFRKIEFAFDKFYFVLVLYAGGLLLSATLSENPGLSFFKYLGELYLIGLAVMAFNLARTPEMLGKIIRVWLAASILSALIGTLTVVFFYLGLSNFLTDFSLHHYGSLPPGNYPRIQGTFLFPSMLCNYLTASLLMLFAAKKLGWVGRPLFALILAFFTITISFTVTPGIGGVIFAAAFWYRFTLKDSGRPAMSKLVMAGGIFTALGFLLVSTFTLITTPTSPYFYSWGGIRIDPTNRLLTWQAAFHTFLQHPFFGKGLGLGVAEVYFMPPSGQMQLLTDAHNVLLNVAGEAGLFGSIPLILICVVLIHRLRLFLPVEDEMSTIRLCLGIAFVSAFLCQGLIGSFENARHLWVLIGLILAVTAHLKPRSECPSIAVKGYKNHLGICNRPGLRIRLILLRK